MTIAAIAARARVSRATVSKALHHYPGVSAATRQRVLAAAAALGVQPRRYRKPSRSSAQTVLLLPLGESLFRQLQRPPLQLTAQVLHAFEQHLREAGYDLLLGPTGLNDADAIALLQAQVGTRCAGVALLPPVSTELARHLQQRRIPAVGLSGIIDHADLAVVTADHAGGTRLLVEHLHLLGHRDVGYLNTGLASRSHDERLQAFLLTATRLGMRYLPGWVMQPAQAPTLHVEDRRAERWHDLLAAFLDRLLAQRRRPTALLCVNDDLARKAIELLALRQVRVPEEMSVTGWGLEQAESQRHELTTIDPRPTQVGAAAAHWLIAQMQRQDGDRGRLLLPVQLAVGLSTAPPPGAASGAGKAISAAGIRRQRNR